MDKLIKNFVNNPDSPLANFELAAHYESIKHYAGAISHFLKCAECGDKEENEGLIYESLMHIAWGFRHIGNRGFTERGWILHAISFCPKRPEAYWMLSQFHEFRKEWQEAYTAACIGLTYTAFDKCDITDSKLKFMGVPGLKIPIGYPHDYVLLFQKAVCAWWVGRTKESRELFFALPTLPLDENYIKYVQNNLSSLGSGRDPFLYYTPDKVDDLRFRFEGCDKIVKNYSQVYQDMFVLSILDGKKEGYYLEIGSADPFHGNNTCLLEQQFGWKGMSIEIKEDLVKRFTEHRKNPVVCRDALTINYASFLKGIEAPKIIDYLQVDCEPPEATYKILLSIPFETFKFRVITFEHDFYADASHKYRDLSREYLKNMGYVLVVNNIAPDEKSSFEDWWVNPELVDKDIFDKMLWVDDTVKNAESYMLNGKRFHWGDFEENPLFLKQVSDEVFVQNDYQKYFDVEEGDVVVDVGASVGPFTYLVLNHNNPKVVYAFEPHKGLFGTLEQNVGSHPNVVLFNSAITKENGSVVIPGLYNENLADKYFQPKLVDGMKWSSFIKDYNIERIDFLKTDCETGEYDIFNEENLPWIKENVKKIAGEWHFFNPQDKDKFVKFRDLYLKEFDNYQVMTSDYIDVKHLVFEDSFLEKYGWCYIYIDNR